MKYNIMCTDERLTYKRFTDKQCATSVTYCCDAVVITVWCIRVAAARN